MIRMVRAVVRSAKAVPLDHDLKRKLKKRHNLGKFERIAHFEIKRTKGERKTQRRNNTEEEQSKNVDERQRRAFALGQNYLCRTKYSSCQFYDVVWRRTRVCLHCLALSVCFWLRLLCGQLIVQF